MHTLSFVYADPRSTSNETCAYGDVRLVNGSNTLEGRVEICINNAWGTVCTRSVSKDDAEVICRQVERLPPGTSMDSLCRQPCIVPHIYFYHT